MRTSSSGFSPIFIMTYCAKNTTDGVILESVKEWVDYVITLERELGILTIVSTDCELAAKYASSKSLFVYVSRSLVVSSLILAYEAVCYGGCGDVTHVIVVESEKGIMQGQDVQNYLVALESLSGSVDEKFALISSKCSPSCDRVYERRSFSLLVNASNDVKRITKSSIHKDDVGFFLSLHFSSSLLGLSTDVLKELSMLSLKGFEGVDSFSIIRSHTLGLRIKSYLEEDGENHGGKIPADTEGVSWGSREVDCLRRWEVAA
ncbi:hypothetical protein QTV49_001858 [Vibrio vulnificus]|nr:hypothetical protein [Vibrio vulnificus]